MTNHVISWLVINLNASMRNFPPAKELFHRQVRLVHIWFYLLFASSPVSDTKSWWTLTSENVAKWCICCLFSVAYISDIGSMTFNFPSKGKCLQISLTWKIIPNLTGIELATCDLNTTYCTLFLQASLKIVVLNTCFHRTP